MELIEIYDVSRIDLLQIEVEGYDCEVIKMIDFRKINPSIIKYEHASLSNNDRTEAHTILKSNGYELFNQGEDSIGVLKSELKHKHTGPYPTGPYCYQ